MIVSAFPFQDLIRWAALTKDYAQIKQRGGGYLLESRDLDSIEISVVPSVHLRMEKLWFEYFSSPEVRSINELTRGNKQTQ